MILFVLLAAFSPWVPEPTAPQKIEFDEMDADTNTDAKDTTTTTSPKTEGLNLQEKGNARGGKEERERGRRRI